MKVRTEMPTTNSTQFSALCYRMVRGKPEVLLVTSRGTGRWILPKGWPMEDRSPAETAQQEAWEEAGVKGKVHDESLGSFDYVKDQGEADIQCRISVYPLKVQKMSDDYPEEGQRRRKWFSLRKAAEKVGEKQLRRILKNFDPTSRS
ncbi:NUDIX hydrolase [Chachezhania sediminis]|uniref:NUDIX hydrolase n=1 Tax=Chachezhania sediminis TaxID=2599291 RepID=UPI001E4AC77D|nr:NUDIX hydrolase [Chachezhania sediminis]